MSQRIQPLSEDIQILSKPAQQKNLRNKQALEQQIQEQIRIFSEQIKQNEKNVIENTTIQSLDGCEKFLIIVFNILCIVLVLPLCYGFFNVQPNTAVILEAFGKPIKLIKEPGLRWYWPYCVIRKYVSTALNTIRLHGSSVPDLSGAPLNVSVVITYVINDPIAAVFNVDNRTKYLQSQSMEVVRRVVGFFKYRSSQIDEPTLSQDSVVIGRYMRELVNLKLKTAGINVTRMELMEISYHPEIAQGMLQIQQAQAKVEARNEIVVGGVSIVKDALTKLKEENINLSDANEQQLINGLMLVVCSDVGRPQPVLNIQ